MERAYKPIRNQHALVKQLQKLAISVRNADLTTLELKVVSEPEGTSPSEVGQQVLESPEYLNQRSRPGFYD